MHTPEGPGPGQRPKLGKRKEACIPGSDLGCSQDRRAYRRLTTRLIPLLGLGMFLGLATQSDGALYVTDQLEITMRAGPALDYKIVKMLPSGLAVEQLEEKEGWARVRAPGGEEGWVVSRYLSSEPPKGPRLEAALRELESLRAGAAAQKAQLETTRAEGDRSATDAKRLQSRLEAVEKEFAAWKKANEDVVALKDKADALSAEQETTHAELDRLRTENRNLKTREIFYWFFSGAAVLLLGWVLGYLYASSRQRSKSRSLFRR